MEKLFLSVTVLIIFFPFKSCTRIINKELELRGDTFTTAAGYCSAATVVQFFFEYSEILNFVYEDDCKLSITLFKALDLNFTFLKVNNLNQPIVLQYAVISSNISYLYQIFHESCNIFSRYLIITQLSKASVIEFANYLWKIHFAFVAFLVIDRKSKTIKIYQHLSNCGNCENRELKLSFTGHCDFLLSPDVRIKGSIQSFYEILCPVNVCKLRFIRVDHGATKEELYNLSENGTKMAADSYGGCVLNAFSQFYNIPITKEYYVSNYNWYNTVKEINSRDVDIGFGPMLPPDHLVFHLEKGPHYTYEEFIFIDAIPENLPTMFALVMPLGMEVWICSTIIALLYYLFLKLLKNLQKNLQKNSAMNKKFSYFHFIAMYFNQYVRLPKRWGLRMVILLWLIYAFLMNAIYTCNFISTIVNAAPKNMLETFDQLRHSDRRFGGPDVVREWLNDSKDLIMIDLYKRYEEINPDNISHALYNLSMVVAQTDYVLIKTGMPDFYVLKEKIASYPLLYYMPKGHPYYSYIYRFLEKIRAGELPLNNCIRLTKKYTNNEFTIVTLAHLQIIFKTLLICHIMSCLVFITECFA